MANLCNEDMLIIPSELFEPATETPKSCFPVEIKALRTKLRKRAECMKANHESLSARDRRRLYHLSLNIRYFAKGIFSAGLLELPQYDSTIQPDPDNDYFVRPCSLSFEDHILRFLYAFTRGETLALHLKDFEFTDRKTGAAPEVDFSDIVLALVPSGGSGYRASDTGVDWHSSIRCDNEFIRTLISSVYSRRRYPMSYSNIKLPCGGYWDFEFVRASELPTIRVCSSEDAANYLRLYEYNKRVRVICEINKRLFNGQPVKKYGANAQAVLYAKQMEIQKFLAVYNPLTGVIKD